MVRHGIVSIPYSSGLSFRVIKNPHLETAILGLNPLFIRSQFQRQIIQKGIQNQKDRIRSQSLIHQVSVSEAKVSPMAGVMGIVKSLNPLFIRSQFQRKS